MTIICVDIQNGEENNGDDNDTKDWKRSTVDVFLADSVKIVKGTNRF